MSLLPGTARRFFTVPFFVGLALGVAGTVAGAGVLGSTVFPDVTTGSYYDLSIGELYQNSIITGFSDGKFRPDDPVTRGQLAVILKRFHDKLETGEWSEGAATNESHSSRSRAERSSSVAQVTSSSVSSISNSLPVNSKGSFRFTTTNFTGGENIGRAIISIVRAGGSEGSASIHYAVTAGTATAGSDYVVASGSLLFENKQTSKTFNVTLLDDTLIEGNETMSITLSSPTNGAGLTGPSTATITILDNETSASSTSALGTFSSSSVPAMGAFRFVAPMYSMYEKGGSVTVTVERFGGSQGAVAVNYATSNGSATASLDYTPASGTLNFAAGETTKTFTVNAIDNSSVNGSKLLNLALTTPTGGSVLGDVKTATITIVDDESQSFGSGSLRFSKTNYDVQQSVGFAVVTVLRSGGSSGTATLSYTTSPGSGSAGTDYVHTSGTLTFASGEAAKTFSVPLLDRKSVV